MTFKEATWEGVCLFCGAPLGVKSIGETWVYRTSVYRNIRCECCGDVWQEEYDMIGIVCKERYLPADCNVNILRADPETWVPL